MIYSAKVITSLCGKDSDFVVKHTPPFGFQLDEQQFIDLKILEEIFDNLSLLTELESQRDLHGRPVKSERSDQSAWISNFSPNESSNEFKVIFTHDIDRTSVLEPFSIAKCGINMLKQNKRDWINSSALFSQPIVKCIQKLLNIENKHGVNAIYFMMSGPFAWNTGGTRYSIKWKSARLIIKLLTEASAEIGLHGSYNAREKNSYSIEKASLEIAINNEIHCHRNHYLRFDPLAIWQQLENAGFSHDFSLGWPDQMGFRAAIGHCFKPWDHLSRRQTKINEIPLVYMDRGDHPNMFPEVLKNIETMLKPISKRGGCVSLLIHPEAFAVNANWFDFYEDLIEMCKSLGATVSNEKYVNSINN
jgi:hypothetical protein